MKKFLAFVFVILLVPVAAFASELSPKDLVFEPDTSGKYIYCNNVEFISRYDLADTSNPKPKYIMNNELESGKYAFFASHVNHTELRDENGAMTEAGFDIELDVKFTAAEDTTVTVTALGFEVPENKKYYYNGNSYTYEEAWGCLNAWASYKQIPIRQMESGKTYEPMAFEPVTVTLKAGETFYLSSIIPNYRAVPFYRPVHLLADFEVSGKTSCDVCAFKSCGDLGSRENLSGNVAFGAYERDRQYKGIADSLNSASVNLSYAVDDWVGGDTFFPVRVYNRYVPDGNDVNVWVTNINPSADIWSKKTAASSDMMKFKYYDPSKRSYYGSGVKDADKDDVWYFDTEHSDTAAFPGNASGKNKITYKPNYELDISSSEEYACNLGNYGVSLVYNYTIKNDGEVTRFAAFNINTTSNNIVIVRDADGEVVNGYALCKGSGSAKSNDTLACIELPGLSETKFSIEVILPTNYVGGMENSLVLKDFPTVIPVYENAYQEVAWDYSWTGREYIKWRGGRLYLSDDLKEWREQPLTSETEKIFHDNWSEYRIMYANGGYVVKPCIYDSIPYYGAREYFRDVYFLNEDFTLKDTVHFNRYPTDMSFAKGEYFVNAGSRYKSTDGKEWSITQQKGSMPVDNGKRFCGYTLNGSIYLSPDGNNYAPVVFFGKKPLFIECVGDVYYSIDKNTLLLSSDGIYWDEYAFDERIDLVRRIGDKISVNGKYEIEYKPTEKTAVSINGKYVSFTDGVHFDENGSALVKGTELAEMLVSDTAFPIGGIGTDGFVPIRACAELAGYKVDYDGKTDTVILTK